MAMNDPEHAIDTDYWDDLPKGNHLRRRPHFLSAINEGQLSDSTKRSPEGRLGPSAPVIRWTLNKLRMTFRLQQQIAHFARAELIPEQSCKDFSIALQSKEGALFAYSEPKFSFRGAE